MGGRLLRTMCPTSAAPSVFSLLRLVQYLIRFELSSWRDRPKKAQDLNNLRIASPHLFRHMRNGPFSDVRAAFYRAEHHGDTKF